MLSKGKEKRSFGRRVDGGWIEGREENEEGGREQQRVARVQRTEWRKMRKEKRGGDR